MARHGRSHSPGGGGGGKLSASLFKLMAVGGAALLSISALVFVSMSGPTTTRATFARGRGPAPGGRATALRLREAVDTRGSTRVLRGAAMDASFAPSAAAAAAAAGSFVDVYAEGLQQLWRPVPKLLGPVAVSVAPPLDGQVPRARRVWRGWGWQRVALASSLRALGLRTGGGGVCRGRCPRW